ncbi:MAG: hypothetical protein JWR72_1788 [Flavisolibacter sp.]|jgi:hypothetical protein|nr:hypothetical protein [Flavisolibacter sp.]
MKVILSLLLFFLVTGCCKVYCDGTELGVSFRKFKAVDTDTVLFTKYQPGTQQTTIIDSFLISYAIPATDTFQSTVSHSISSAYDWKITVASVNKQYIITGFELTGEHCNCSGKNYKAIKSFLVNGDRKQGLYVDVE